MNYVLKRRSARPQRDHLPPAQNPSGKRGTLSQVRLPPYSIYCFPFFRIFEPYGEEKLRKYKRKYELERNVVPSWKQKSSHPAVQKRERSKKPAPFEPVRIRTPPDYFVEAPLFPTNGTFGGGLREEFSPFSLCSEGDSEFVTPPTSPIPSRTPTPPPDPVSRTSTTSSMEEEKEDALPSCCEFFFPNYQNSRIWILFESRKCETMDYHGQRPCCLIPAAGLSNIKGGSEFGGFFRHLFL